MTRQYGISSSWRDELGRYTSVDFSPYATPLRRVSVVLIGLAVLGLATRRTREGRLLDLPGMMLVSALLLLVLTPSKHPWHFGALTGLVTLAIGAEVTRLCREHAERTGWEVRPYLIIGAGVRYTALLTWP